MAGVLFRESGLQMTGPYTTITVERFQTMENVARAADNFLKVAAEFPDEPSAWGEWMEALENAVERYKKKTEDV